MKLRNVLITAAFLLAVTSTFAIKANRKTYPYITYKVAGICHAATSPEDCDESYTGAQCTYLGFPAWAYDATGFPPPTCTIPLRRFE